MNNIWKNTDVINIIGEIISKEKMQEGLCNDVFLINTLKGKFIIKIATNETRKEELNKEYNLIKKLKKSINFPEIYLYQNTDNYSFFIMEYIEGNKPTLFTDDVLKSMAQTLKHIHKTHSTNKRVDFNNLLNLAEQNMKEGKLDLDEFVRDNIRHEPINILQFLRDNKPEVKSCLLHGDYRPKNMLISNNNLYVLDWGLSFVGDPYYDLAIIKWYFSEDEFRKFIKFYGIKKLDEKRLEYNEWLSAFLNV